MRSLGELWKELADVKDELASRDWFPGTSGNLSIKVSGDPITFLVTASGKDKRKRTNEDFVLVDVSGNSVEETHLRASAETGLHAKVYQHTDAGCCLHIHTVDNNIISELYGDQGEITFRGQELIKAFNIWEEDGSFTVPIIENPADLSVLAERFAEAITQDTKAVLIRNHGVTVWGKNGFEAKKYLEALEFLFSYHVKMRLLQPQYAF
ncbi:methylthioribulose-1-phosphate dehydratase [Fictibacillus enclensis]|uniref:Methylthioribulose-1-phosphate dehydratase n=1 Tax=Fictibacillus enclensis TaxID=1017270 RepID=A0A0V8JCB4_9BACL|nr:methylthioribulose 1-phosphate dehydratase [Fictibacillus enclensis]KSU84802.1 methylthioribulose-1-phosphate dehydratase [Fictibacillus enclensis]SCB86003.1 methylthioribulose-1-phosphate dehydratase [Fictibacillus enclensis]